VAGIPILKKRVVSATGRRIADVIKLITTGCHQEALNAVLLPPPPPTVTRAPASVHALHKWRERAEALFSTPVDEITACEFIDFYFRQSGQEAWEGYSYFLFRFGIPRHLVPLAFATLIAEPNDPLLDLGCGFGHSTRCLLKGAEGQRIIGIDEDFFGLHVARNWVATKAQYVCCAADSSLPFVDGAFSAAFCTDAFQSFKNKLACVRELRRLVWKNGVIVLASLRNKLVNDSAYARMSPLAPEGYAALFTDMPHSLIADTDVLARYLEKKGPALGRRADDVGRLADADWLSLVASYREGVFHDYGGFDDWPHAYGQLTLNPLYREQTRDKLEDIQFRRAFPSVWYQRENAAYEHKQYLPETVSVGQATLTDLAQGRRTAEVEALIEQCVVIGLPERYLPANFSRDSEYVERTKGFVGGTFYIAEIGVSDLIASLIPPDAVSIVVDEGAWEAEDIAGRRALPFLERDGKYWGKPLDDDTAIRELERLREAGAAFLVFLSPAMWWLDYYTGFSRYLCMTFRCILQSDSLAAFDLRQKYTSETTESECRGLI
jgi:ubiquinone/menaquinone biosynthesis C-methylase UbiE